MAEADQLEQPVVPPADIDASSTPAADADPEARYRYDESKLIKVKGRVKRPSKPDEAERNIQIEMLKAEREKHSRRMDEIKEIIDSLRATRNGSNSATQEIVQRLRSLQQQFQTVLRQKQHIREELESVHRSLDELRSAQRALRDRVPRGLTPDTLEEKIAELAFKQQHDPGDKDSEAGLYKRLRELEQARGPMRDLADIEARLKPQEDARTQIKARLAECDAVLNASKAQQEVEQKILDERRSKQSELEGDIPQLLVEKKECYEIVQALRAKINEVYAEYNVKYKEYIDLDRNYNNYMRHVKRQDYLERQKAREERAAAENGMDSSNPDAPSSAANNDMPVVEAYAAEVFTIEQLVGYLRKLLPSDDQKAVVEAEVKAVEVPKGMKLLKKKDEEEEFFAVPKKKKEQGKKGSEPRLSSKPAPAAVAAAEPSKKKLQHSLETLKTFMGFAVEVPQTVAELPGTIEKLEAKKAEFLELRKNPPAKQQKAAEADGEVESQTLTADEVHGAAPAKAGTEAGLDAVTQPEPGQAAEAEAESEAEADPVEAEPDAEGDADIEPEATPEPGAKTAAEPEAEAEVKADTDFEAAAEPEPDAAAEPEAEAAAEPEAEAAAEPEAEAAAEPEAEAAAEPEAEAAAEPEAEAAAEPEAEAAAEPEAEAAAEPEAEAAAEPEAEAAAELNVLVESEGVSDEPQQSAPDASMHAAASEGLNLPAVLDDAPTQAEAAVPAASKQSVLEQAQEPVAEKQVDAEPKAEAQEAVGNGHAEAAPSVSSDADGLGLSLSVDDVTSAVSVKLSITEEVAA